MTTRILLLGGTTEARQLAERLASDARFDVVLSLAGRTVSPKKIPVETRVGGFGGVEGLVSHLRDGDFDVLVDATHPFAAQMSSNAGRAGDVVGKPIVRLESPAWQRLKDDNWTPVASLEAAVDALVDVPQVVFLGVGRQSLEPFAANPHHPSVTRVIDPPEVPAAMKSHEVITGLGPFRTEDEVALFQAKKIDVVVTKNSGGKATASKIAAARTLGLPVIIVERPTPPDGNYAAQFPSVDKTLSWLVAHYDSLTKRSV